MDEGAVLALVIILGMALYFFGVPISFLEPHASDEIPTFQIGFHDGLNETYNPPEGRLFIEYLNGYKEGIRARYHDP